MPSLVFDLHRLGSTCETSEECSNRGRQDWEPVNYGMFRRNAAVNSGFSESIFSLIEDEVKFAQPNLISEFLDKGKLCLKIMISKLKSWNFQIYLVFKLLMAYFAKYFSTLQFELSKTR